MLGGLLQGIKVKDGHFAGGALDWLTPFPLFCGLALLCGYALLGATWLIYKTDGDLEVWARGKARLALLLLLGAAAAISLWTPMTIPRIAERWFSWPNIALLSPVPIVTALTAFWCWRGLEEHKQLQPFASAIALFLLGFAGLVISNVPYLVPDTLTVWQAAAAPSSQIFMLIGTLIMLPIILGYTVFVYWTFRGKVRAGEGYH